MSQVEMRKEAVLKEHRSLVFSLLFLPPNILLSASADTRICILNLDTMKIIHKIEEFDNYIYDIVKYSSNSFLACSYDNEVKGFIISEEKSVVSKFVRMSFTGPVLKLLQLNLGNNSSQFLVALSEAKFVVADFKQKKIVRELHNEHILYYVSFGLVLAKFYDDCFYVSNNRDTDSGKIRLVNFVNGKVEKSFGKKIFGCLWCYLDSHGREVLIAGSSGRDSSELCFYYTDKTEMFQNVKNCHLEISSLLLVKNRFLFVGALGFLEIFDIIKIGLGNIFEDEFHGDLINDIVLLDNHEKDNCIKVCSASDDRMIIIASFHSNLFENNIDLDELERVEYLKLNYCEKLKIMFYSHDFQVNRVLLCL